MTSILMEWLNLLLRWFHLIAGIGWIGSSFYFMWLDSSLEPPTTRKDGVEGELWMVHSGGFYQVEKRLIDAASMPAVLHWFKYEALLTWVSGIFLLGVVYYFSGGIYLIDPTRADLSIGQAVALSLGVIAVAWFVYDGLYASKIADRWPRLSTAVSFLLLFGLVFGLCHAFSGRAAFIHVGAVLGTIMVANVWVRILPAQQKMIDATKVGQKPDYTHGLRAKRRSVHNSYVTLPVIVIMISNHYPSLYAHDLNWLSLVLLIACGASVRHVMILNSKKKNGWPWLVPAFGLLAALVALGAMPRAVSMPLPVEGTAKVTEDEVLEILHRRCVQCHSEAPSDDVFTAAPNGVMFETYAQAVAMKGGIKLRVVDTATMPLANKTEMTQAERDTLGRWLSQ